MVLNVKNEKRAVAVIRDKKYKCILIFETKEDADAFLKTRQIDGLLVPTDVHSGLSNINALEL
jgi:hypothetical protein